MRSLSRFFKKLFAWIWSLLNPQPRRPSDVGELLPDWDIDERVERLKLLQKARKQGEQNLPKATDVQFDGPQHEIVNEVTKKVDDIVAKNNERVVDHTKEIHRIHIDKAAGELDTLPDDFRMEWKDWEENVSFDLSDLKQTLVSATAAVKDFRKEHSLSRPPRDVDLSTLKTYIAFCLLGQVLVNAGFFMIGQPRGFMDGVLIAAAFATVDVMSSYWLGNGVRLWKGWLRWQRTVGAAAILGASVWCLGFNLFVAHYRETMKEVPAPDNLLTAAGLRLLEQTVNFPEAYSVLLFALGFMLSVAVTVNGYRADDPIPEYGELGRRRKTAQAELDGNIAPVRAGMKNAFGEYTHRIEAKRSELDDLLLRLQVQIETKAARLTNMRGLFKKAELAINTLLHIYRDANRRARTDGEEPAYFQEDYQLERPDWLNDDMSKDYEHLEYQTARLKSTREACDEILEDLSELLTRLLNQLNVRTTENGDL